MASEKVTVIPGNHDAYVADVVVGGHLRAAVRLATRPRSCAPGRSPTRLPGCATAVALVAVNTCVPTGDFGAWGEIGAAAADGAGERCCAPPSCGAARASCCCTIRRSCTARPRTATCATGPLLAELLARAGAELVIHGHDHRDERATLAGPAGRSIPVVGAGSASYDGPSHRRSRYNVYEIEARHITAITYAHDDRQRPISRRRPGSALTSRARPLLPSTLLAGAGARSSPRFRG